MSEETVTLPITGMSCANCAANIERGFKKLDGIEEASVNFASEQAQVRFDANELTVADLVASIQRSGYKVPATHVELPITGMTCANCAANIERVLNKKVDGVVKASVNFATERAAVDYLPDVVTIDESWRPSKRRATAPSRRTRPGMPKMPSMQARHAEISDQTRKFIVGRDFCDRRFLC